MNSCGIALVLFFFLLLALVLLFTTSIYWIGIYSCACQDSSSYEEIRERVSTIIRSNYAVSISGTAPSGPCVFVGYHHGICHLDSLCVHLLNRKQVNVVVKHDSNIDKKQLERTVGAVVYTKGFDSMLHDLSEAYRKGEDVLVFPTGKYDKTNLKVEDLHTSIFKIAHKYNIPIVPFIVDKHGLYNILKIPNQKLDIYVGEALVGDTYTEKMHAFVTYLQTRY
jgi:1-acyl-sn-glycerol-3-phosphate acyltransferase